MIQVKVYAFKIQNTQNVKFVEFLCLILWIRFKCLKGTEPLDGDNLISVVQNSKRS